MPDRILNILDLAIANQCNVKAYIGAVPFRMQSKRRIGGLQKPHLLARQQGIGRVLKRLAGFNLNKNKGLRVRDNKVNLP